MVLHFSSLKIASVNVRGIASKFNKCEDLNNYIIENDIDIVCIQEWKTNNFNNNNVILQFPEQYFSNYQAFKSERTAILVKSNIDIIKLDHIKLNSNENHWINWIGIHNASEATIIGSYYRSPTKNTGNPQLIQSNINAIKKYISKKCRFIITGDFNATHITWDNNYDSSNIVSNYIGDIVYDWTNKSQLTIVNDGNPTFINKVTKKEKAIDLTIITNQLNNRIKDWSIDSTQLSDSWTADHYILNFTYELINFSTFSGKDTKFTWRLNAPQAHWDNYLKLLSVSIQHWYKLYHQWKDKPEKISDLGYALIDIIKQSALLSIGYKQYNNNSVGWFKPELKPLFKKCKQFRFKINRMKKRNPKCVNSSFYQNTLKEYLKLNNIRKKLIKNAKREFINKLNKEIYEASIQENQKIFYRLINKIEPKRQPTIPPLRDQNGTIKYYSVKEKANALHIHFNTAVQAQFDEQITNENQQHYSLINQIFQSIEFKDENPNSLLNRPFTYQEVYQVLVTQNKQSCMGNDHIHPMLLYYGRHILTDVFQCYWNLQLSSGIVPFYYRTREFYPLPKPKRDHSIPKNIRPIQITSILSRNFCKALANRLQTYLFENKILNNWNIAFQKNKETLDILLALNEDTLYCFENNTINETLILDFSQAYDSVWIEGLLVKLYQCGIRGRFLRWLINYYSSGFNRVKMNQYVTKWAKAFIALFQGDPLSPIFFVFYINDLNLNSQFHVNNSVSNYLNKINFNIFADDGCLYQRNSILHYLNRLKLQETLGSYTKWAQKYKLILNSNKCNSICFTQLINIKAYVYQINNEEINIVHHFLNQPTNCVHNYHQQYLNMNNNKMDSNENNNDYTYQYNDVNDNIFTCNRSFNPNPVAKYLRILGLRFDPKLNWDEQVKYIIGISKQNLKKLSLIAYSKAFRISALALWRLYQSNIQSRIEYAIPIYYPRINKAKLEIIKNDAMRIALRANNSTPIEFLYLSLDETSFEERVEKIQMKYWEKYIYAPEGSLRHETFHLWKKYMLDHSTQHPLRYNLRNNNNDKNQLLLNFDQLKFMNKSALSAMYQTKRKYYNKPIILERNPEWFMALPTYIIPIPSNIITIYNLEDKNNQMSQWFNNLDKNLVVHIYTDGSVFDNPGPAGMGWFSEDITINFANQTPLIHLQSINKVELFIIFRILYFICNNKYTSNKKFKYIAIFTDSLNSIDLINGTHYPKYNEIYNIIQNIFKQLHKMFHIKLILIKVKAHKNDNPTIHNKNNSKADFHAKKAAIAAKHQLPNYNHSEFKTNSIMTQIKLNDRLWKSTIQQRRVERIELLLENNHFSYHFWNMFTQKFMNKTMKEKIQFVNLTTKCFKNEYKYLNGYQTEIIIKLRSEHIRLNNYRKTIVKDIRSDLCPYCLNTIENVDHFLLWCPNYKEERDNLFYNLATFTSHFNNPINRNVLSLLFPHLWQCHPNWKDERFKEKVKINLRQRISILKEICYFLINSERFKDKEM